MVIKSSAVLAAIAIAIPVDAHAVNVSETWCGGGCSEGHDEAECLCELRAGGDPGNPADWNDCYSQSCCTQPQHVCDFSDVIWWDGNQPGGALPAMPSNPSGWAYCTKWEDYYYHCVNCMGYDPGYCDAWWCQYLDDQGCWIPPGQSSCTYSSVGGTSGQNHFDVPGGTCVRNNETGAWSWAAFWSLISGTDTCSLGEQTPWDDPNGPPDAVWVCN